MEGERDPVGARRGQDDGPSQTLPFFFRASDRLSLPKTNSCIQSRTPEGPNKNASRSLRPSKVGACGMNRPSLMRERTHKADGPSFLHFLMRSVCRHRMHTRRERSQHGRPCSSIGVQLPLAFAFLPTSMGSKASRSEKRHRRT